MADTISFIQGSDSLVLNTGDYAVQEIDLTSGPPDALTHMPDYGENRVVRTEDKDRQATLQMRIIGADWDDVYNNITEIRRWLKEAARAEVDGDTDTVYLQLKRSTDGSTATNATNNQIRYGWVDGDSSAWTPYAQNVEQALVIFVHLVLTPYGEATAVTTLNNALASSPHFVEDSDADGLCDGWNNTANPATTIEINTDSWLVGGQSQQFTTDNASTEGVISDLVTVGIPTSIVAYVWIWAAAASDPITIQLVDGADANIDNIEHNPASPTGYDMSFVDTVGYIWYRYVVSGPSVANANAKLIVQRTAGNASIVSLFRIDACYMETGTVTAPNCFASTPDLENRCDPAVAESNINYIDIWGIPGDAPAKMLLTNTFDNAAINYYQVWCLEQDGINLADDIPYVIENTSFALISGTGTWTANDGAGQHANSYGRYDTHGAAETGGRIGTSFSAANSALLAGREFKVYVRCQANEDTGYISLDIGTGDGTVQSRTAHIFAANNYELKNVGIYRPSLILDSEAAIVSLQLYLDIAGMTAGANFFDVDAVFLMPVDKGAIITKQWANGDVTYIDGPRNSSYCDLGLSDYVGQPFDLLPGSISNRLRVLNYDIATDDHDMANAFPITLEITPRTRHLLGTM